MSFFSGCEVLVTGGTGLIGRPLVKLLIEAGANVRIASLDDQSRAPSGAKFFNTDLRNFSECMKVTDGCDIVFHLIGIKGSAAMTIEKPASFIVPTITCNTNVMEAARRSGVSRYLYTSSICVYKQEEILYEDDVWKTFPSENDRFMGWAKRLGELQAQAYLKQYNWDKISIVRPANVYGLYDNFDPKNAMVIPSLIHRVISGENPLVVWGDGSPIRDFIHANDVAKGMMNVVEKGYNLPVNLGSGVGVTIKRITEILCSLVPNLKIKWDETKPTGDRQRLMDISRAKSLGFKQTISIEEGIKETLNWYSKNYKQAGNRYNSFIETS